MYPRSYYIIAAFTLAQLLLLLIFGYTPYPDSDGYILLAEESIAHGEPYPVTSLLNIYPFLWNAGAVNAAALSLRLFHSVTPLLIVYCLMKGATAWFLWRITRHLFNDKTAFVALLLYVIYPANYGEGTSALSELPFMFFIMAGIYFCLLRRQNLLGGMSIALANWFRPMGIVYLSAIIIYLLTTHRHSIREAFKRHSIKAIVQHRSIKIVVSPLAGYLLMIAIIGGLTYHRTGLFLYQAKTGWMALTDYSTNHSPKSLSVRDHTEWNVAQKDSAWQSLFIEWVKQHPTEYARQMPKKLVDTYVSDNVNMCAFVPDKDKKSYIYDEVSMPTLLHTFPRWSPVQWLTLTNLLVYLSLLLAATGSLIYLKKRSDAHHSKKNAYTFKKSSYLLSLSVILLGTLLLLFAGHGEARFHIPFMPFIIMLAAVFIANTIKTTANTIKTEEKKT